MFTVLNDNPRKKYAASDLNGEGHQIALLQVCLLGSRRTMNRRHAMLHVCFSTECLSST